ncbi:hypothetical protein RhiirA4_459523 [Rhizophagus irregularis]|uniref:Uncharacterized protein n=1 Tax=Rhizophagus irregularis TaxID=588596 RepID=A0A2I1GEI5_9GLOM|nr:hypothetical protein RhiirA4_459523 [Rhizophagus irregularis]
MNHDSTFAGALEYMPDEVLLSIINEEEIAYGPKVDLVCLIVDNQMYRSFGLDNPSSSYFERLKPSTGLSSASNSALCSDTLNASDLENASNNPFFACSLVPSHSPVNVLILSHKPFSTSTFLA